MLVLTGIIVGCGAGATVATTEAQSPAKSPMESAHGGGSWSCYRTDRLHNVEKAKTEDAQEVAVSLNKISAASPVDTIIDIGSTASTVPLVCAKN